MNRSSVSLSLMPNWKRIIAGDAFSLSSRRGNYYRDLALLWPFILFSLSAVSEFFSPTASRHYWAVLGVVAVVLLGLAKEKFLLLLGSLAWVAVRSLWAVVMIGHDRNLILVGAASWLVLPIGVFLGRRYRPSCYEWPREVGTLDTLIGVGSLAVTLALKIWLDAHLT